MTVKATILPSGPSIAARMIQQFTQGALVSPVIIATGDVLINAQANIPALGVGMVSAGFFIAGQTGLIEQEKQADRSAIRSMLKRSPTDTMLI